MHPDHHFPNNLLCLSTKWRFMMQPEQTFFSYGTYSLDSYPTSKNQAFLRAVSNLDLPGKRSWFDRQGECDIRSVRDPQMTLDKLIEVVGTKPTHATLQIRNNRGINSNDEIRLHVEGMLEDRTRVSAWIECPLTASNYRQIADAFTTAYGHTLGS